MPYLRILLGYRTEHRNSLPAVLSAGFDAAALQRAADAAPVEFQRFEIGTFSFQKKARRSLTTQPPTGAPSPDENSGEATGENLESLTEEIRALVEELEKVRAEKAELIEQLNGAVSTKDSLAAQLADLALPPQLESNPAKETTALPVSQPPVAPSPGAAGDDDGPTLDALVGKAAGESDLERKRRK